MIPSKYTPGKHNIGRADVTVKRIQTSIFLALTIFVILVLFEAQFDRIWRLIVFIPSVFFGIYFQQWFLRFNILFGIKGIYNFGEYGQKETVVSDDDKKKDYAKAWQLYYSAFFLGMGITSLIYYW
jgi:hypothetical protein